MRFPQKFYDAGRLTKYYLYLSESVRKTDVGRVGGEWFGVVFQDIINCKVLTYRCKDPSPTHSSSIPVDQTTACPALKEKTEKIMLR